MVIFGQTQVQRGESREEWRFLSVLSGANGIGTVANRIGGGSATVGNGASVGCEASGENGDVAAGIGDGAACTGNIASGAGEGNYILDSVNELTGRGRLVTLWDIMEKHMKAYAGIVAQELCLLSAAEVALHKKTANDTLPKPMIDLLKFHANTLLEFATELEMPASKMKAARLFHYTLNSTNALELRTRARDLTETMIHELFEVKFLPASVDMISFLDKRKPFGLHAAQAFQECNEDISEATQCFAFERYTACVFHLGRVMEKATARISKKMRVGKPDDDWQGHLKAIHKSIDSMPYGTKSEREKRAPYLEAVGFSFQFKEAWRNPTAHPEQTYTRQQALDVMNGARAFMDSVARKIFKVKTPKIASP